MHFSEDMWIKGWDINVKGKQFHILFYLLILLLEKAGNVRRSLRDLGLSEDRYYELRGQNEDDLSLRDYVAVSIVLFLF
jgi:hypothetical protein